MTRKKSEIPPPPSFEDALAELEGLVDTLEQGELSLEDSLRTFERGVVLARTCQEALARAEQKVAILSAADENADLTPFDSE